MSTAVTGSDARAALIETFAAHAPRQVAEMLARAEPAEAAPVVAGLATAGAARVMAAMAYDNGARVLALLGAEEAARICGELEAGPLANLVRRLPPDQRDLLLGALSVNARRGVTRLLAQPTDRVGAHMDPEVLALPEDATTAAALEAAAALRESTLDAVYVFGRHHELLGRVPWHRLLGMAKTTPIGTLVSPEPATLSPELTLVDAAESEGWTRTSTLPVVDDEGRLLGVLRHHALRRALGELATSSEADPANTASELAGLYAVGAAALWRLAGAALPKERR